MSTVVTEGAPPSAAMPAREVGSRRRRIGLALAGPALIVASVLFAMRGFAFQPLLTNRHPDILAFWLSQYCFLGKSLAAGHIPAWNPFQFAGTPFAADPQSGWLYAPAMLLFSLFSCGAAVRMFIVLQPLLAGLGLYWFLRKESLHRLAATVGGLSIAMMLAASQIGISLPFAGTLAWTPYVLVGAAGYLSTERWSRRLGWMALAAFAWGQVANAHMSHGLAMCTLITAAYLTARSVQNVRRGRTRPLPAAGMALAFLAFLPLATLAVFIPRLALIARSSLRGGYAALGARLAQVAGIHDRPLMTNGVFSGWPFVVGSAPGAYAGAVTLLALPLALRTRRYRYLSAAFFLTGVVAYVLTLNALIAASWFRALVLRLPFGDVYLHNPGRLRYLIFLVVPVLGALGIQGLFERPLRNVRVAVAWLGAGAVVFLGLPLLFGANAQRYTLLAIGVAVAAPFLFRIGRHSWAPVAVVGVLAVELFAGAVYSQVYSGGTVFLGLEGSDHPNLLAGPLRWPDVSVGDYTTPGPIARYLQTHNGRYLTWAPPAVFYEKGYLFNQEEEDWPALADGQGTLFGIEDSLGYNPLQLPRYWSYVRATDDLSIFYNASVLQSPTLQNAQLLGLRYLVVPQGISPPIAGRIVARQYGYDLYEVSGWEPQASLVPAWSAAPDAAGALRQVLQPGFDPSSFAVVEKNPAIPTGLPASRDGSAPGTAQAHPAGDSEIRISVVAHEPALLVVRVPYDSGWHATVNGADAPILRADYFLQAVSVPAGSSQVTFSYDDPRIGEGLLASGIVWVALFGAIGAAMLGERRRRRGNEVTQRATRAAAPPDGSGAPGLSDPPPGS
jgi:hypothetical protein